MNLSGEFRNKARCALAMSPAMVATIASIYLVGPSALIPAVIGAAIAYPAIKAIGNLGHDHNLLTRMEPTERWKEIAKNMGFKKVPPVYRLESDEENAEAGFGNVVMRGKLLDNHKQDEIDDTFAHELAHIKRRDGMIIPTGQSMAMLTITQAIWHVYDVIFFNSGSSEESLREASAFIILGLATGLTIPFFSEKRCAESDHEMEFDCDERAVLATGDVDAGIRSLYRFVTGSCWDYVDSRTHPAINDRIEALKIIKAKQDGNVAYLFANDLSPNQHSRVQIADSTPRDFVMN